MKKIIVVIILLFIAASPARAQRKLVRIFVSTPHVIHRDYIAIADVMAGTVMRELNRSGGMELIDRIEAETMLKSVGFGEFVQDREQALKAGEKLGVDIVIFSTLRKNYDDFLYTIAFLEIDRDVVQRTLKGSIRGSSSPMEIGRIMRKQAEILLKFVPLPSEIADFGSIIREVTVDPENLPSSSDIDNIPRIEMHGFVEQVFSYLRVFPGEQEYNKFEKQKLVPNLNIRPDLDEELTEILDKYNVIGDFAIRHGLQAYLIKDCSVRAINLLLANKLPVFYIDGILLGYSNMSPDGYCVFRNIDGTHVESDALSHRKRVAVFFVAPKLGKKHGFSREYLERSVGFFYDEMGKRPTLVEIKDSMFDIISGGLD